MAEIDERVIEVEPEFDADGTASEQVERSETE